MAEAAAVAAFGASLGGSGGPDPGPGPLQHLCWGILGALGRRLRRLRTHPAGHRPWLFLGGSLGLCEAVGLDPSLGVVGAIAGGLPHSPLLPGGLRGVLGLLLFAGGLWLLLGLILRLGLRLLLGGTGGALGGPGPPPRLWLALVRMFAGHRPRLQSYQGVLPPLPLPPLRDTVQKAVASLEVLGEGRGGEGRGGVSSLARQFLGGPGPRLQRWLRLRSWLLPSYLSDLWEEQVLLGGRGPLPTSGSHYLMDLLGPPPSHVQAARAANVTFALLRFRGLVRSGALPPVLFQGTLPTCSAQYERIFNTSRVPGERRDRLHHGGGGSDVAALCRGRLFRVPVTRRGGGGAGEGSPLPPRQLQLQFQRVLDQARDDGGGEGEERTPHPSPNPQLTPGALTAGDRLPWARARALLEGGGANGAALRLLDQTPFLVALDDPPPPTPGSTSPSPTPRDGQLDAEAKELLLGPPHNRWFDKSLTLVVLSSGRVGLSAELSWGDPPVLGHLWEYALATDVLELGYEGTGNCRGGVEPRAPPPPQRLDWDIPPEVLGSLGGAVGAARALASDLQLHVAVAPPPPGPPPTPDALVQLAIELALLRERGRCLSYRAVPTRLFLEGRGEGSRGCGPPVLELAAALGDPQTGRGRRRALLGVAVRAQRAGLRAAMTGAGLDRHLQALAAVANQLRLRPPFLREVLGRPWALSCSPSPRAEPPLLPPTLRSAGGGFAPPHPDGYGVSYALGGGADDVIIFHVTCHVSSPLTDARRFAAEIRAALGELGELWGGGEE